MELRGLVSEISKKKNRHFLGTGTNCCRFYIGNLPLEKSKRNYISY